VVGWLVAWFVALLVCGVDVLGEVPAHPMPQPPHSPPPHTHKQTNTRLNPHQGAAIGDVFVSTGKMHHDRRIPLPGFDKFGLGFARSPSTPRMQAALGLKPGVVTSGDSLDYTDRCMEIMREHGASVKEMEAGSIAWVAGLFDKPMLCIKAITDIVDGDRAANEEFLENLHAAAAALQGMLPRVLEFVGGKTLGEL